MDPIHSSVWTFLAAKCKDSPLLPRLRSLLILDMHLSDIPCLILLMSPSLLSLDSFFVLKQDEEDRQTIPYVVRSLMEMLPVMAPNLEKFYCDVDVDLGHGYVGAFSQFARLKTLYIMSLALNEGALQALSAIATLEDLSCSINLSNGSAPILRPCTFQRLTGLHVIGSIDDLTAFINAFQLPSLIRISLSIREPPHAREPVDLFAAVYRRCNTALLTSFRAHINYAFLFPRPTCLMQYLEPVVALPNIESFYLSFARAMPSISDDDLARVLQDSTESMAGSYRARGTPEVLRIVEVMAMNQARQWGVCTMNEFRAFLGLKRFDTFEEWNSDPEIAVRLLTSSHSLARPHCRSRLSSVMSAVAPAARCLGCVEMKMEMAGLTDVSCFSERRAPVVWSHRQPRTLPRSTGGGKLGSEPYLTCGLLTHVSVWSRKSWAWGRRQAFAVATP